MWSNLTGHVAVVVVLVNLILGATSLAIHPRYDNHEILEKRDFTPHAWTKRSRLEADTVLPVRIALAQRNIHRAEDFILEVAGPSSPKYGQHWTPKQVAEAFAPSRETAQEVKEWLHNAGVSPDCVEVAPSGGWLAFNATASEVEDLLKTKYHVYEHEETGFLQIASDAYSVPSAIRKHIDFITPTLHFGKSAVVPRSEESKKRSKARAVKRSPDTSNPHSLAKANGDMASNADSDDLSTCDSQITLDCLRALYGIPDEPLTAPNNSFGICEYGNQVYRQDDLDMFFTNYSSALVGVSPIMNSIDGGSLYNASNTDSVFLESNLDFQYAMPLTQPLRTNLYQTGDFIESYDYNMFLDAIDSSYCTYDGGDDPTLDDVYPDPAAGGYKGSRDCGIYKSAYVLSTSYAQDEYYLTSAYANRECHEYMKLGLMGVTVMFASGDYGVAGDFGDCTGANGIHDVFHPEFPASCPYVTAVGGTQIGVNNSVAAPEVAVFDVVYSGGGFSNIFPIPSWQNSTLAEWWQDHTPAYSFQQFNNSQQTRGLPDVSANAANYIVADEGEFILLYGTSAASPVFASVITRINDARLNAGKSTVGFVNPVLYASPNVLNDITEGNNPGCNTNGFDAVKGWDPVTGLGTPNYSKMLDLFMAMP